mmetsp:Transcript_50117/g.106645  ORF Transcript_50117/g.106645 Transcript_50117/m.106645 type:complete len:453 (-) Transcript_50117:32-1390(-)
MACTICLNPRNEPSHPRPTMGKLLMLSIVCSSLALILTLQLRTSNILHSDPIFSSSLPQHRRLLSYGLQGWKFFKPRNDPRTVDVKEGTTTTDRAKNRKDVPILAPIHVCDRVAPIPHDIDIHITQKYSDCPLLKKPPEKTTLLLLEGVETFGRTGNNLIEFLHSVQYAKDNDFVVGIMMGSWPTHLITNMWMAIRVGDMATWREFVEQAFCVKIIDSYAEAEQYEKLIRMETRDLFLYKHEGPLNQYVEFQGHIIRSLYRSYNDGIGFNMRRKPVGDMCSVLDAMFGSEKHSAVYSVVHSRSLEGEPGLRLLGRIARNIGCDPVAALDMDPEYVKAILAPRGMLEHPILFITDHQRPEILEKLLADPEIGPNIHLIPDEASWVGGDITVAVMSNVFIGNPASSFSGFIAKSRVALGYDTNYLFRKKTNKGEWVDVCDERCIFDQKVMNAMA